MNNIIRNLGILSVIALTAVTFLFGQEQREVRRTIDLSKDGEVRIDTYKGSITVETWDKPQVDIYARIEQDGWDRDQKDYVRETEIRIDNTPQRVRIETDYNKLKSHHHSFFGLFENNSMTLPLVHYKIMMPKSARLYVKDYKSESNISNIQSAIEFNTYKGRLTVTELSGSIDLETYKGDVTVDFSKFSGNSRIETMKGRINIRVPQNAGFNLDADLGRKADLNSDFETVVKTKHRGDESYRVTINGGGPSLRIESEKGSIRIKKQ